MRKTSLFLMITQTICLYLSVVILYSSSFLENLGFSPEVVNKVVYGYYILLLIAIVAAFANIIVSIFAGIKGEKNPAKSVMIIKFILIPWFISNFIFCVLVSTVLAFTPLLFVTPVFVALSIVVTYLLMISTSAPNIFYFIYLLKNRKISLLLVVSIVLQFIFACDAIGACCQYVSTKESSSVN